MTEAGLSTSGQGTLPVVRSVAAETPLVEPAVDVAETTGGTGTETNASVASAAALATDANVGVGTEGTAAVDDATDAAADARRRRRNGRR